MRTPFVRFLITFAFSVASAWSTVTGTLDVRFSMAVAVAAGFFWGRGALIAGLIGQSAAYFLLGNAAERSVVNGHLGVLIAVGVLAILETLALFVAIEHTISRVQPETPANRIWKFLKPSTSRPENLERTGIAKISEIAK